MMTTETRCVFFVSKQISIPSGVKDFISPPLFSASGFTPIRLFGCFFDQERLSGSLTKSIHHFERPRTLRSCQLLLDSRVLQNFTTPATTDFESGELLRLYCNVLMCTGAFYDSSRHFDISYEDYCTHQFILSFDLTSTSAMNTRALPMTSAGELRAKFAFDTPIAQPLNFLLFAISPALMKIDKDRQISLSYRV